MDLLLQSFIKSQPTFTRLEKDIFSGRLAHALLLTNPDSLLLEYFAISLVESILVSKGLKNLAAKAQKKRLSDLMIINDEKSIKVETLIPLLESSAEHGIESDQKFFIILNCDKMTIEAQNKLLKTIEEPNSDHYYFLCTPSKFLVLPTIVSRCNVVEVSTPSKENLLNIFYKSENFSTNAKKNIELSLGRLSEINNSTNSSFELALQALQNINSSANVLEYAMAFQRCNLKEVLQYIEFILIDLIKCMANLKSIWFESQITEINKIKNLNSKGIIYIFNTLQKIKGLLNVNVSQTILADKLALAIAEGKHI